MLNTYGYVSLGPYLCITVEVPANNDFRRKILHEIVATMNHCRSAPLRRSQQSTTLTRHRKYPIDNRSCVGLWTITRCHCIWTSPWVLFLRGGFHLKSFQCFVGSTVIHSMITLFTMIGVEKSFAEFHTHFFRYKCMSSSFCCHTR